MQNVNSFKKAFHNAYIYLPRKGKVTVDSKYLFTRVAKTFSAANQNSKF